MPESDDEEDTCPSTSRSRTTARLTVGRREFRDSTTAALTAVQTAAPTVVRTAAPTVAPMAVPTVVPTAARMVARTAAPASGAAWTAP